jgi:hypothetical protein
MIPHDRNTVGSVHCSRGSQPMLHRNILPPSSGESDILHGDGEKRATKDASFTFNATVGSGIAQSV